jgi:adenosine kinase
MEREILVLGAIAYDNIMAFEGLHYENLSVDAASKKFYLSIMPNKRWVNFGGTSGNISYNLALLGAKTRVITSVGKDYRSGGYADHHKQFPMLRMDLNIHEDVLTASAYIVNDKANNLVNIFHPGAIDRSIEIDLRKRHVTGEGIAIASISPDNPGAMINWAKQLTELRIKFLFDPGQVTPVFSGEVLREILPGSWLLIGNEFEIGMIQEKLGTDLTGLLKIVPRVVITKGEAGSTIYEGNQLWQIPIVPPKTIIDTTGAGDGYRSGLLYGVFNGCDLLHACRIGATVSSFVIETAGPQSQKFTLSEFKARYERKFNEKFPVA